MPPYRSSSDSCPDKVFDETLKVGDKVNKGDHLGWFLFGSSDIVYLFQKGVTFSLASTEHLLQGEKMGTLQQSDPH